MTISFTLPPMVFAALSAFREPTLWLQGWFREPMQDATAQMRQKKPVDPNKARLSRQIDAYLKRVYLTLMAEPVPDRLKQLMSRLRKKEDDK